jgi:PAS domain S-box-containing protein
MDIRTKLVFALVGVALGSMLALGVAMYVLAEEPLQEARIEELEGRATSMKVALEQIAQGWEDRVRLIASRTQLRAILQRYPQNPTEEARTRVRQILGDARTSVDVVETLVVYDAQGNFVASAGQPAAGDFPDTVTPLVNGEEVVYQGVLQGSQESLLVEYAATLNLNGEKVGTLHTRLTADALSDLTEDRAGLGATGEAMIVVRDQQGVVRVLRRLGESGPSMWIPVEPRGPQDPVSLALEAPGADRPEGLTDDEGNPIWAAVRYLPEKGWGLVVKIEASEGRTTISRLQEELVELGLSLGAIAIVLGTILGLRFAKPIYDLARVADRIRSGALSARAEVTTQDEVGYLARTMNEMVEEMEQKVTLLREFQRYFDVSLDMLCIAGTDGYFKRVNPAFERVLGWSEEELLSQSFMDFVDSADQEATQEEIEKLAKGIPTISFENWYHCADGSKKRLAWTAYPEEGTGLIYAIARDVTDLREKQLRAEEEIRSLRSRLREAEDKLRGAP